MLFLSPPKSFRRAKPINQSDSGRRRVSLEVAVTRWELVLDRGGDESLIVAASPAGTYSNFGYRR